MKLLNKAITMKGVVREVIESETFNTESEKQTWPRERLFQRLLIYYFSRNTA